MKVLYIVSFDETSFRPSPTSASSSRTAAAATPAPTPVVAVANVYVDGGGSSH